MKKYSVKEIFGPTIQGEGYMTGVVTHFLRFSICNMWNGRQEDKEKSNCPFCDTDFLDGKKLTVQEIINKINQLPKCKWVTVSGGEPLLQFDRELCEAIKKEGYLVAVETNGTIRLDFDVDHLTLSPKVPMENLNQKSADTLKILYPHPDPKMTPESFNGFETQKKYLQPIIGKDVEETAWNLKKTIEKLYEGGGRWRFSPQIHKLIGVQ